VLDRQQRSGCETVARMADSVFSAAIHRGRPTLYYEEAQFEDLPLDDLGAWSVSFTLSLIHKQRCRLQHSILTTWTMRSPQQSESQSGEILP
jgi:hypothetical protein